MITRILFIALALAATGMHAQDGTFDPTFNPTDQGMARFDGLHWSQQTPLFPDEGVRTMTVQPDGKLLVGGWFPGGVLSIEDPVLRPGIARLNLDGTQDVSFTPGTGFDGPVEVMVVQPDGKILVGGAFLNFNGSPRKGIARLNADGSLDAAFTVGTGTGGTVFEIAVQPDGRILLGGNFTTFNALPANRIVRLLSDGSFDPSFVIGAGFDANVTTIAIQVDGKVLVGGPFTSYQGQPRNHITRLNVNGSLDFAYLDPAVVSGPDEPITDIAIGTGGAAFVAGNFNQFNGASSGGMAKLDATGAPMATFFSPSAGFDPRLAYDAGTNILTIWGNAIAYGMKKVNGTTGSQVYGWNEIHDDWYYRTSCNYLIMYWHGTTVGPSGEVYRLDPIHSGIIRLNNDLTLDDTFAPGRGLGWSAAGLAMDQFGRAVLAGRMSFNTTYAAYNGRYQPDLARLGYDGEHDPAFNYTNGTEGHIQNVWAVSNGYLLTGDLGQSCGPAVIAWSTYRSWIYHDVTNTFSGLAIPGCESPVIADLVERADGSIVFTGGSICSGSIINVGRFAPGGTWDASYTTVELTGETVCLDEAPDGRVYVAGDFTQANGLPRNRIVRLLVNGGVDPTFDPLAGFNGRVREVIVNPDGTIVCIGDFTTYRGMPAPHIAKLLPNASMDPAFDPGTGIANTPMCMLRYPDGRILIGGAIPMYDGNVVNGIVCINGDGSIDESFDQGEGFRLNNPAINGGTPGGGWVMDMEMQFDGKVVCMGEFHMYDGNGRNRLARIGSGASVMLMARVLLEGAYDGAGGMAAELGAPLIPLQEPYKALGYQQFGGGSESISPAVLLQQGPQAVVDWIRVELRNANDPSAIVATRSGLLLANGSIVDTDGQSMLRFWGTPQGQYYVAVRHRNHLGAMTATPIFLGFSPFQLDFGSTFMPLYGTDAMKVDGNDRMLWAGDVDHDGSLRYIGQDNDRDPILVAIGGSVPTNTVTGYKLEDVNLDGVVKYIGQDNDRDPILVNIGGSVPTSTRQEQLP